ncbi:MAG: methionine--tRNA ligase [Candidatus Marinimicrobia bacterium]|jgi:methionyl-tRNA synthetase|nr:methionine--tRNA ligase [Candidatus Neomarinimicrobiota bacterium]MBT3634564.1 methionine--tRNA ligase [Candidatus Neomarinimicrobiota bacterium]MBT3683355.1 methionine--tRNA ligase [Candidatus Neomarinimicrobiota bacterium]MBT3760218.1 methionine--tRNA ligase [Candidatus Neomarinimicrobiota bacterium]MBT3896313.1 methionine--tRNA ligase [Candidatus Neomarinimicrobiota bacterium]
MGKFYITTPLYYVNDDPHIGHAYTTILADVLARYHRTLGDDVFFLTGTDEHGQKVQQAAAKRNVSPQDHVDEYVIHFKDMWEKLHINYDDFIRTTDKRHTDRVKEALTGLYDRGEIYSDEYEGLYSVSEERFVTEKEVEEGDFREIIKLKERNYFFKMSKYQDALKQHINDNPDFIKPVTRKNEILGFLEKDLNDLCISRPKSRLEWGIELPFDEDYVTYVWFDALLNYITAIGWQVDEEKFNKWWPVNYQLMGKDILTTHAVYWCTMLMALGESLPQTILAHGWWLMGDSKMSKSKGNVVRPLELIDEYGVDPVRYFLMRDMVLGQDSSFTMDAFIRRYNSDLANDFGNLVNRVTILIRKNYEGVIPEPGAFSDEDNKLIKAAEGTPEIVHEHIGNLRINEAIESTIALLRKINGYLEVKAPWKSLKLDKDQGSAGATTLYIASNVLRIGAQLLSSVMPSRIKIILAMLGAEKIGLNDYTFDALKSGTVLGKGKSPFPRIDTT